MRKWIALFCPLIALILMMVACGAAPVDQQVAVTTPAAVGEATETQAPTQTPNTIAPSGGAPNVPPTPGGAPATNPTPAPPMATWPLEADLFYLNSAGQVWRQPFAGPESTAAAVTQAETTVRDFAVAPGGEWIVYRTDGFVAISSTDGFSGQLISEAGMPQPGDKPARTLVWSSDASKLAYGTSNGFEVYIPGAGDFFGPLIFSVVERPLKDLSWSRNAEWLLIWRDDGSAALYQSKPSMTLWVELGQISGMTWLLDGRLAFAPVQGGLALLNPADLTSRVFMVPQDRQVSQPGQRPDGTLAFFVHPSSVDNVGYLHLGNPSDQSFHQESGTPVIASNYLWNPVATRLLSRDDTDTIVEMLDPSTGSTSTFQASGVPVAFDWGDPPPQGVTGMSLPANLYFLAPEAGIVQVWRLAANGGTPTTITAAPTDVLDFDISPDETQVVYTSGGVVSRKVISTLDVTQVVTLATDPNFPIIYGSPAFSPTGRKIAYANRGIWVLDLDSGQSTRLVADTVPTQNGLERNLIIYGVPEWSLDGAWLLVRAGYYEGYDHALLSASGIPALPISLNQYVSEVQWVAPDLALVFSGGGAYSEPHLTTVQPAATPTLIRLFDLPIVDAILRPDGRLALLRIPSPLGLGPTSVRLYSAQATGGSATPESSSFVMEAPELSPDGVMIVGLLESINTETGRYAGRLVIANTSTGELFTIEGVGNVSDIQWGGD